MYAASTLNRALNDWLSVLMAAERAAATMRAETDDQQQLLATLDDEAVEPDYLAKLQSRIDERMTQIRERVAAAQQTVEAVAGELSTAENNLRQWSGNVAMLRERLSDLPPV
jgi:chromosome segregation ATPase